ncbi:hypothetical protein [Mailhella sp.]|uniref:hypothetical protein n=1 Tax=Mailhella sp. TaxID=1981029 RepID=UPI0040640984
MELFSFHTLMTALSILYWIVVCIAFLVCVMSGSLRGKWLWCFLIWTLTFLAELLFFSSISRLMPLQECYPLLLSPLLAFAFDRWKKWGLSAAQYLYISLFSLPFILSLYIVLLFIGMSTGCR